MRRAVLACAGFVVIALGSWAAPPATEDVVSTRELANLNWMEIQKAIPSKIDTVILPTGTLEPHGVINNGADITAPVAIARAIATEVNAVVAPVIPYGMTGSMDAFPGSFSISEDAYRAYVRDVLRGLAKAKFRTIVIVNGHGGPQTAVLNAVAAEVGAEKKVRTLVVNWWTYASDVTLEVFGQDGGHAALNETAFVQAIDKSLVHAELYKPEMVTPNPLPGTYSAYPSPSSITLYKAGQGFPDFDPKKADEYFAKVNKKIAGLVLEMKKKWDMAGL
jgi:creatinine amidohydrolase